MADDGALWRQEVSQRLENSANQHKDTAVILERLKGELDGHAIRLNTLEGYPSNQRQSAATFFQMISTIVGIGGCLISPIAAGVVSLVVGVFIFLLTR